MELDQVTQRRISEIVEVPHAGTTLRFHAPTPLVRANAASLLLSEPTTIAWLQSMNRDEVLLDVGANIGIYSIYAATIPETIVYAFEPEALNYAELNKNIRLNRLQNRVTAYCLALSDSGRVGDLYLSTFDVGFGHHDFGENVWAEDLRRGDITYKRNSRPVQGAISATIDELAASGAIPVPTHIKIDVDGLEWRVLAGATYVLEDPAVKTVLVETDFGLPQSVETMHFMMERGWLYAEDQMRVLRSRVLPEGGLEELVRRATGQQNLIYFRDESYFTYFREFRLAYEPKIALMRRLGYQWATDE